MQPRPNQELNSRPLDLKSIPLRYHAILHDSVRVMNLCDERVCLSVCPSVRSRISKNTCLNFTKSSAHVNRAHKYIYSPPPLMFRERRRVFT